MARAADASLAVTSRRAVSYPLRRRDGQAATGRLDASRDRRLVARQCTPAPACRTASAHPGTGLNLVTTPARAGWPGPGTATGGPAAGHDDRPGTAAPGQGPARNLARDLAAAGLTARRLPSMGEASR